MLKLYLSFMSLQIHLIHIAENLNIRTIFFQNIYNYLFLLKKAVPLRTKFLE